MYSLTYFNKNFRFVFTPYPSHPLYLLIHSYRFLIGSGQLCNYLGNQKNAETVFKTAEKMKTDKSTLKFRKYGKIEIYVK